MKATSRGAILAIDTATDLPGVALHHGGSTFMRAIGWRASFRETAPAARALLGEAGLAIGDLAVVAVPAGPGSFTGLRVGATFAVALARAAGIALHAVPTLEAVAEAYALPGTDRVCAVLDARRGRWYAALVDHDGAGWRTTAGPFDLAPEEVKRLAGESPRVGLSAREAGPTDRERSEPAPIAAAVARLVALDMERYAVVSPGALRLVYTRPATQA